MSLTEELYTRIMLYVSHPVADNVKSSIVFDKRRLLLISHHGCPFDRGCSDAYHGRQPWPHYWRKADRVDILTDTEIEEYRIGYMTETRRRW